MRSGIQVDWKGIYSDVKTSALKEGLTCNSKLMCLCAYVCSLATSSWMCVL